MLLLWDDVERFVFVYFDLRFAMRGARRTTDQVGGNEGPDEEAHVDVDRVTAVLGDLGQTSQSRRYHEAKDQQRFEQLGAVRDGGVEVHLEEEQEEVGLVEEGGRRGNGHLWREEGRGGERAGGRPVSGGQKRRGG